LLTFKNLLTLFHLRYCRWQLLRQLFSKLRSKSRIRNYSVGMAVSCGSTDEGLDRSCEKPRGGRCDGLLEVLGKSAVTVEPRDGSFHDPPSRQDFEALCGVESLDDRNHPFAQGLQGTLQFLARIPTIAIPTFGTKAACRSAEPSVSSARARSLTQRVSTDECCVMSSPTTTLPPMSGPVRPIGAGRTRRGLDVWSRRLMVHYPPANGRMRRQGQRRQIEGPCPCRTCVRPAARPDGAVHPHYRHQAHRSQDHPRQPRLQHAPLDLPRTTGSDGITAPETQKRYQKPATWGTKPHPSRQITSRTHRAAQHNGLMEVPISHTKLVGTPCGTPHKNS